MPKAKAQPSRSNRIDVVFIRKSTSGQNEEAQKRNVEGMLKAKGVQIADADWFVCVVKRRAVRGNADFMRLLELVQADRVGTIYIESQDRWGTKDRPELFSLIGTLRQHETQLFDLRDNRDITKRDLPSELMTFLGSVKSEIELKDLSYRSLRTRVQNFQENGSWPTGPHPFGYAKACYSPAGELLWVWHPSSRSIGQIYNATERGKLVPGTSGIRIPRKQKHDRIQLVPSIHVKHIETVRLVFDLFIRVGLSRRQIAVRLNQEGRTYYDKPFRYSLVGLILNNPAYAGDTHFGKTKSGDYTTFGSDGQMVRFEGDLSKKSVRQVKDRIVKQNTHQPLIDRKVWDAAQAKLASEKGRTSFAPRRPEYYLKQILVCGHCGKGMVGRTEKDPRTKKPTVVYICGTYSAAWSDGRPQTCGFHRITHEDAEKLLLAKLSEQKLEFDSIVSAGARDNVQRRLQRLGSDDDEMWNRWRRDMEQGVDALIEYMRDVCGEKALKGSKLEGLRQDLWEWYCGDDTLDLKEIVEAAEAKTVATARKKIQQLTKAHEKLTLAFALDSMSAMQREILKKKADETEAELKEWQSRVVPLSQRLAEFAEADEKLRNEQDTLLKEFPNLELREKGEAFRRVFNCVRLFWSREFKPSRQSASDDKRRRTKRTGRYRYTLKTEQIEWSFATTDLARSS